MRQGDGVPVTRLALLLAVLLAGCSSWKVGPFPHDPEQPVAPDPWDNQDDPTWGAKRHATAVDACAWFARNHCPEAAGTRSGVSCVDTLQASEDQRPQRFTFGFACIVAQKPGDCAGASACAHPIP